MPLSKVSLEKIEEIALQLDYFENSRALLRTLPQQISELENIKKQAQNLSESISAIGWQSDKTLSCELMDTSFPGDMLAFDRGVGLPMSQWKAVTFSLLKTLIEAVDASAAHIGDEGRNGGRLKVTEYYSIYISNMARIVCTNDNIQPGRGGVFEQICAAMFDAAGVHAKPEGAIRAFMKRSGDDVKALMSGAAENMV